MYVKNQALSVIFKFSALLLGGWALRDSFDPEHMCYYTNLSNLLCALYYFFSLLWQIGFSNRRQTTFLPRFKGGLVIGILATMTVYDLLIGSFDGSVENKIVHYIVPVMTALDWILFDRKGVFKGYDPLWWTLIPSTYAVFIFLRAKFGHAISFFVSTGRYPYWFIDVDTLGAATVMKHCAVVAVCFVAAGYALYLIDLMCSRAGKSARGKK